MVNEILRKQYNKKWMQLCGDVDIRSFVRISWLNWICHFNRIDSKRKVRQIYNNNPEGSPVREWLKTDGGNVYEQILINA